MFELLLSRGVVASLPPGPGPATLIAGNNTNGLYGTVDAADFFTGSSLATACGVGGVGTLINDNTKWIKASLDGKTVYYPMLPIRHGLSWNTLNANGLITPAQNKRVTLGGRTYQVRCFTAIGVGDANLNVPSSPASTAGSDYNRLIYRVCAETPPGVTVTKFANYTLNELGLSLAPGCCFICQEENGNQYFQRNGGTGSAGSDPWYSMQTSVAKTLADQYRGWRPLLELVA